MWKSNFSHMLALTFVVASSFFQGYRTPPLDFEVFVSCKCSAISVKPKFRPAKLLKMALSRLCTRRLQSSITTAAAAAATTTSTSFSTARISSFSSSNFSFLTNPAAESSTNYSNGSYLSQLREPTRFPTKSILDVSRRLSTSSGPSPAKPNNPEEPNSSNPPEKDTEAEPADPFASLKHQEIEGPTVERDLSPLANETRDVLARLRRSLYDLSRGIALLGIAQLVCGSWIAWIARAGENGAAALPMEVTVQSVVAFAFPFATAFLLRQAVKPMAFFAKMEGLGRLQILTLCLQVVKGVDQTVRRVRIVSVFSAAGILIALSAVIWSK